MPILLPPDPDNIGGVVSRAELLSGGYTDSRIRSLVASGRWTSLGPGTYRTSNATPGTSRWESATLDHVRWCAAAAGRRRRSVVGGASAVLAHGLPLVSGTPAQVTLLVPSGDWVGTRGSVHSRLAHLAEEDVTVVLGPDGQPFPVTSVARTWVDIARTHSLGDALSVGDAALRLGLMTHEEVREVLDRIGRAWGRRRAESALLHLSPLRESPLESGSCAHFITWKFPTPRLQHTFHDERGPIARTDCDWPEHRVLGFADGMGKYGQDPTRDRAERHQESRLRPHGIVARWGWPDMAGDGRPLYYLLAPLLGIFRPFAQPPR